MLQYWMAERLNFKEMSTGGNGEYSYPSILRPNFHENGPISLVKVPSLCWTNLAFGGFDCGAKGRSF